MSGADPLKPSVALLAKLGSIAGHTEEMMGPGGHAFDRAALDSLLEDPEVRAWLSGMRAMALIPEPRT